MRGRRYDVVQRTLALAGAVLWATSRDLVHADASKLVCPLAIAPRTLTMACGAACPNALSPCLYFANATDCVAEEDSGSVCVNSSLPASSCAIECFSPFSGDSSDAWNFMVTSLGEYKQDVADRRTRDPTFRLAKKDAAQVTSIRDLKFPSSTKTIAITGDALPILNKAVDYPVIYNGFSVGIDMGNFSFLEKAVDATTIILENINLTALTTFPLLPKLTALQLSNGKLRAIPQGIAKLPTLQRLEVSLTTLGTIADGALPTNLVDLCLQDSGLDELPRAIANMTQLKKLDLAGNKFTLPPAGSLPLQVEHLIWWGFYHQLLPPDFPKMTKLKILEMGWNDFSDASALTLLPDSLEELHMIDVMLSELPTSFTSLKNLAWMELGKNNIQRVATNTVPPNMKFLNLSINYIAEIEAGALPLCLETLDLRFNKLECRSFPVDFSSLTQLKALYLHENALTCVPPAVFSLPMLETLTLHRNLNMSKLTLNESEVSFLGQLKTLKVDQECLETNCEKPVVIGATPYTVCLTGDTTIKNTTSSNSTTGDGGAGASSGNKALIIGCAVAIGGLVAILIGAVHWKRRRDAANVVMQHPGNDDDNKGGMGASELYAIEEHRREGEGASDATAYAEMTHGEAHYRTTSGSAMEVSSSSTTADGKHIKTKVIKKTTTTTTTTTGDATKAGAVTSVSTTTTQMTGDASDRFSVWDDHELLQYRLEFAAIRDVQLLSSGMYGEVWLAIYMSRHVAVKRLKKNLSGRGGAAVTGAESDNDASAHRKTIQQFVQEIKIHSRMDHPKIVSFLGVAWTMESDIQVVVEYMATGDLRSFLSSLQPKFETLDDDHGDGDDEHHWDATALQIAIDVAEALVYLHSLDPPVLHRDLKSRNVLLDDALQAKVADFGVSRYHFDDDTHVNMTTNMGTARWAAPEVLTGSEANYTSAIDMYSLGIILSELDTWAVPFSEHVGVADSALLTQVMAGELLPRFRSSSPREIVTLAKKCLATDPKKRPTAVDVAYTLRQCLTKSQASAQHVYGLASAGRGSMSSSRASVTAVGPAVAMSL